MMDILKLMKAAFLALFLVTLLNFMSAREAQVSSDANKKAQLAESSGFTENEKTAPVDF